jgi:DNA-binding FadR family transcriptional regulator
MMLGVRRSGVTEALQALRDEGAVATRRGSIVVLDRERLEALSCECYAIVRGEYERQLGRVFNGPLNR